MRSSDGEGRSIRSDALYPSGKLRSFWITLPLQRAEPLPGPPDRDVALAKLLCGVLDDILNPDLLFGLPSCSYLRANPAGNRSLIKHLCKFINGRRFALSSAFKTERTAKRSTLGLVSFPGRTKGASPEPLHSEIGVGGNYPVRIQLIRIELAGVSADCHVVRHS